MPSDSTSSTAATLAVDIRRFPWIRRFATDYAFEFDRVSPFFTGDPASPQAWAEAIRRRHAHRGSPDAIVRVTAEEALQQAPLGTLNEPWGVAVGPDGSVYVSDTWNHRIQKFTAEGKPVKAWGQYGQPAPEDPTTLSSFWGPRGIAVDSQGRVFVADTGNKRIAVFDEDGNYITEFGGAGFDPGQFDEPVGVAVSSDGTVYVADTWNQRVQSFIPNEDRSLYFPLNQWEVSAWFGQSLENKPFIAVGGDKHVFITDPEGYRVIEFTENGEFVRTWGDYGVGVDEIGLAAGIAVDKDGFVWITDAANNRILRYTLPQ